MNLTLIVLGQYLPGLIRLSFSALSAVVLYSSLRRRWLD